MTSQDEIRYHDFRTVARINERVVSLTKEKHEYIGDDERRLRELLAEVEGTANDEERTESIVQKVSLLTFG